MSTRGQLPIEPQSHSSSASPSRSKAGQTRKTKGLRDYGSKGLGFYGSMGSKSNERSVFQFARKLKTEEPNASLARKLDRFKAWHVENLSRVDFDDAWPAFLKAFKSVRHKEGEGPLSEAHRRAMQSPISLPGLSRKSQLSVMAALCRELQLLTASGQPFPAATRPISVLFNTSHRTISSWLDVLTNEMGLLKRHSPGSFEDHRAGLYFFIQAEPRRQQ